MTKMDWERMKQRSASARRDPIAPTGGPGGPLQGGLAIKKFGKCPRCGSAKWWDNTPRKMLGRYKKTAPDARCATCDYTIWPS